ncbi:hypothetical protein FA95DRAFT_1195730 [Auriscalpium vulgare]|uniref:Uncharacterized protein n=1 Tax=Auriscalpium vulgare TaxID=40419 RepID=A0ACB8RUU9_9AGAM|nr:hypothetical protein FA95DRAFT_1195730 [Auriscalpium vulgare]
MRLAGCPLKSAGDARYFMSPLVETASFRGHTLYSSCYISAHPYRQTDRRLLARARLLPLRPPCHAGLPWATLSHIFPCTCTYYHRLARYAYSRISHYSCLFRCRLCLSLCLLFVFRFTLGHLATFGRLCKYTYICLHESCPASCIAVFLTYIDCSWSAATLAIVIIGRTISAVRLTTRWHLQRAAFRRFL